jgi:biotin transport system substrate-specific component
VVISDLLWALIGLILTIGGTFLEAFAANPWQWGKSDLPVASLGVTYQIGAVLLTGCLGGKNAGFLSQAAYLLLGLVWFPIFAQGGGLGYLKEPSFGYLLGFIPGAWVCGYLAFKTVLRLEMLALSCLGGLLCIHLSGIVYLLGARLLGNLPEPELVKALMKYSLNPLPGQLGVVCAASLLAFAVRQALFY